MTLDEQRIRRLGELGIELWCRRDARTERTSVDGSTAVPARNPAVSPESGSSTPSASPRIRLAPGRGRWLLVGDGTDRPDVRGLLDDLRGLLGAEHCRFGQWSDSAESGVAAGDWSERGIDWVLDFGGPGAADARVVSLPPLIDLVESSDARKQLWQALRPLLETD